MEKILINKVEVLGSVAPKKEKGQFELRFEVEGENNYRLFNHLLNQNTLDIKVPSLEHDFKAKKVSLSSAYRGHLSADTRATFYFSYEQYSELEEKEKEEEEKEWSPLGGITATAINNWARTRALASFLIEKEYFSHEEYEERIKQIKEADLEEMRAFIFEGKVKES